ncbi:hypothetical protein JCM10212_004726 [Sporobolomyces blumeae]
MGSSTRTNQPYLSVARDEPSVYPASSDEADVSDPSRISRAPIRDESHRAFVAIFRTIERSDHDAPEVRINGFSCAFVRSVPILLTVVWTSSLLTLLYLWIFRDEMDRSEFAMPSAFPFPSDLTYRSPLLTLVSTTAVAILVMQSVEQERFLRFKRVLVEATDETWVWVGVGVLDCALGIAASVCLILFGVFDARSYPRDNSLYKIGFFTCLVLSGLLNTVEVEHLWHEHPDRYDLRDGTYLKYTSLWISLAAANVSRVFYVVCRDGFSRDDREGWERCYRMMTGSAILEWVACFALGGWFATLALDVWPMSRHAPVHPRFSATSRGLTHVHRSSRNDDDDDDDEKARFEIPNGCLVRRLPMMTRPFVVGFANGRTNDVDDATKRDENRFEWFEEGKASPTTRSRRFSASRRDEGRTRRRTSHGVDAGAV